MQRLDLSEIREFVAERLPSAYETLQLTFYGRDARASGDDFIIGDDYGTELRVRRECGAVYSVDPEKALPTRFVNSTVENLAAFVHLMQSYSHRPEGEGNLRMWTELATIDPPAFADAENWWALILQQVRHGLL
jgi:SUKH-4 immunity protein of toxin-antitoxin system